jgi:hypothetical protein
MDLEQEQHGKMVMEIRQVARKTRETEVPLRKRFMHKKKEYRLRKTRETEVPLRERFMHKKKSTA